jgi:hypothetical protein
VAIRTTPTSRGGVEIAEHRVVAVAAQLERVAIAGHAEHPGDAVGEERLERCGDQDTATKIAKYANPYLLHMPLPGMDHLPSFAFMSSPAEIPRGPVYEFMLQHAVALESPFDLVRSSGP